MIRSVNKGDLDIHHRTTGNNAFPHGLNDAFFNRRNILSGDNTTNDLVFEHKAAATRERFHLDPAVGKLASSAGLFLMFSLDPGLAFDRLLIRDLRDIELHLHPEFSLYLFTCNLQMDLADTGDKGLVGFGVASKLQSRVFFEHLRD